MDKPKIVAAGGLVQNENGELLMIYRRGKWDLPKGKLDKGESIEACALREVTEETGVRNLQLGALIDIGYHEYFDKYLQQEVIKETHWFRMSATGTQHLVPQTEEDIT
ncbi:MAG: NUDIX domain-containing protein, partial [Chitinophagaceae bacterium]|nr:NUDIX domain-containing protein [Chitinophagaceae bacterium]